ncbi:MAG TPA: hypothetical protein VGB77_04495 [Abditibacteriaceae bacterium]|jgi:hypothetical protein
MKKIALFSILLLVPVFLNGCAKTPVGGPTLPATNRLTVNMTLQQAISPTFFYNFAFDDDGDAGDGPAAVIGTTTLANGVVGGSFSVLVQCRGNNFLVFRRRDLGNGQETLERASNAFVVNPVASGNTITFTLDLDATIDNAATPPTAADRLFAAGVTQLDVNFVTTSEVIRDPNNLLLKPFDALGEVPRAPNLYETFNISTTRTFRNVDTVREPSNDADPGNTNISAQQLASLDITDFTIDVRRSN